MDTLWECLTNWLDFEPCDLNVKVTRGQKITNQTHYCAHNTAETSGLNSMKLYQIMYYGSLVNRPDFGICDLISKVTVVKKAKYVVSGSRMIFLDR